jgi:hypothetical protein
MAAEKTSADWLPPTVNFGIKINRCTNFTLMQINRLLGERDADFESGALTNLNDHQPFQA